MSRKVDTYNRIEFPVESLRILSVEGGNIDFDAIRDYSDVFHEEVEIKLYYEGGSTLLVGNEAIEVQEGDLVFINPYEFHSTINYGAKKGKYRLLMIGLDFFENSDFSLDLRYLFIKERTAFESCIRQNERMVRIVEDIVYEMQEKQAMYESVVRDMVPLVWNRVTCLRIFPPSNGDLTTFI